MKQKNEEYWLQITSGQGPDECAFAVKKVSERVMLEAKNSNIEARVIEAHPASQPGTYLSILVSIKGNDLKDFINSWQGTIQWVCQSPFRPTHKRKNWFIRIDAFSSYAAENLDVKLEDITFQTMRASGPGGQHVNTTDSAVRITHTPTGITVTASEERSQHQNKKLAVARIASELTKRQKANLAKEQKKQNHLGSKFIISY